MSEVIVGTPEPEREPRTSALVVEFGELPPAPRGKASEWDPVFRALKSRPGEWARLRTYKTAGGAQSAASSLRQGKTPGSRPGEYEATVRGRDLWARYIAPHEPRRGPGRPRIVRDDSP